MSAQIIFLSVCVCINAYIIHTRTHWYNRYVRTNTRTRVQVIFDPPATASLNHVQKSFQFSGCSCVRGRIHTCITHTQIHTCRYYACVCTRACYMFSLTRFATAPLGHVQNQDCFKFLSVFVHIYTCMIHIHVHLPTHKCHVWHINVMCINVMCAHTLTHTHAYTGSIWPHHHSTSQSHTRWCSLQISFCIQMGGSQRMGRVIKRLFFWIFAGGSRGFVYSDICESNLRVSCMFVCARQIWVGFVGINACMHSRLYTSSMYMHKYSTDMYVHMHYACF
jgi:hypothetical protein